MPLTSLVDRARDLVVTRGWGVLDDAGLVRHQRALAADAAFSPRMSQIAHLQDVEKTTASGEGIRRFAELDPFADDARRAIVVRPGQPVTFGLMRMFAFLTTREPEAMHVQFDHVEQAERWLGISGYVLPEAPRRAPGKQDT